MYNSTSTTIVHIVYIVYNYNVFSCIAYEPMAYGINELELEISGHIDIEFCL